MNNPKHISGISELITTEQDDINDILKIENEILQGTPTQHISEEDIAKDYAEEIKNLSNDFNPIPLSNTNDNNDNNDNSLYDETTDKISTQNNTESIPSWNTFITKDPHLAKLTEEEQRQSHINTVLNADDKNDEDDELGFSIDKERDEDEKASLLEQIDMLRQILEDDGFNLSGVPDVTHYSKIKEIKNVHRILRFKNDRNRYCNLANEVILSCAYGMEYLFDGEKEWIGRRPDLIGWPETVKVKLRRIRYDTSSFVQEMMLGYNTSPGWRLLFELLPSMFLHSRDRKLSHNDNFVNDITKSNYKKKDEINIQYNNAVSMLNSIS